MLWWSVLFGGLYGAINFNNMIPVPDEALIVKIISAETDPNYKRLLQNQYNSIQDDWSSIQRVAENLRTLIITPDNKLKEHDIAIKQRCCNLKLLESIYQNYNQN